MSRGRNLTADCICLVVATLQLYLLEAAVQLLNISIAASSIMSWRNQGGVTGSNNIPLGKRRFGGDDEGSRDAKDSGDAKSEEITRGRSPVRGMLFFFPILETLTLQWSADCSTADPPADGVKRRKKRNRWGDAQENKAAGLMGLPTMIMANFTNEQLEAYALHLRIEEISQKLRINDVVPADGDR